MSEGHKKAPQVSDLEGKEAEREGLEPPSPFGRSLSRRVHYHSASAPRPRIRRDQDCASAILDTAAEAAGLSRVVRI